MNPDKFHVIDIETTGLDPWSDKILLIGNAGYQGDDRVVVMHNASFDVRFMKLHGHANISCDFDSLIAAYCLPNRPKSLSLDSCAAYYLGYPSWKDDMKSGAAHKDLELLKRYCQKDCEVTLELAKHLYAELVKCGRLEFFKRLMEARAVLTDVELTGMYLDKNRLKELVYQLDPEIVQLTTDLNQLAAVQIKEWQDFEIGKKLDKKGEPGSLARAKELDRLQQSLSKTPQFNWGSPKQVLFMLHKLGIDTTHPLTGKESTDVRVLERATEASPIVAKLLELRKCEKLLSSLTGLTEEIKPDGRIHGSFNLTITETGRLSSSNPNLQNIDKTKRVRRLFTATPGRKLIIADYAQIEPGLAAHYSKDEALINTFRSGEDFYGVLATKVLRVNCRPNEVKERFPKERAVAKVVGLSILYGTGSNRLREEIKRNTSLDLGMDGALQVIKDYFREFAGLKELQRGVTRTIEDRGYIVNICGRHLDIAAEDSFRYGVNYLLQSSASDLLLFRALELVNELRGIAKLIALVHDEVLFECDAEHADHVARTVKAHLEHPGDLGLRVPLKADTVIANDWSEKG